MAKLIFTDKIFSGRVYELVLEKTTVGRGDQNTVVIRDNTLSSAHCEILMHGTEVIVRDLDSRNGTFVNGVRLNKQSQVKSGQAVRFGAVEARLELGPLSEEDNTTEITAIYTLGKVMRDQRRAQKQPPPATASMQLDPNASPSPDEQTILIPRSDLPQPALTPPPDERQSPAESRSLSRLSVIIAFARLGWMVVGCLGMGWR